MAGQVENQQQHLSRLLKMKDGSGDDSYHRNSTSAGRAIEVAKDYIEESALQTAQIHGSRYRTIHIADLGCSSGKNSITAAKMIVNTFKKGFVANQIDPDPQLLVFFNDLPSNDFNNLFGILSNDDSKDSLAKTGGVFTAGVSGSFYGRLFPDRSLHFVISSLSIQWMSQVPEPVIKKNSTAWNPDSVWFSETNPAVAKAYAAQFESDFLSFLRLRAKEVVCKGRMVLLIVGRQSKDPIMQGPGELITKFFNQAFQDMIFKGWLTKDKLETFNLPVYYPSVEEVKEIVERDSSFEVRRVEWMKYLEEFHLQMDTKQKMEQAKSISKPLKSIFEPVVEDHIGKDASTRFFDSVDAIVANGWEKVVNYWRQGGFVFIELECKKHHDLA